MFRNVPTVSLLAAKLWIPCSQSTPALWGCFKEGLTEPMKLYSSIQGLEVHGFLYSMFSCHVIALCPVCPRLFKRFHLTEQSEQILQLNIATESLQ